MTKAVGCVIRDFGVPPLRDRDGKAIRTLGMGTVCPVLRTLCKDMVGALNMFRISDFELQVSGLSGQGGRHSRRSPARQPERPRERLLSLQLQAASILGRPLKTRCQFGGAQQDRINEAMLKVMTEIGVPFGVVSLPGGPAEAAPPKVTKDGTEKNAV